MRICIKRIFLLSGICLFFSGCLLKPVSKVKNVVYDEQLNLKLDVFAPRKREKQADVLVFIHGGNWRAGTRGFYRFFGKGMARKGIVSVVIDYRLNKLTDYKGMAADAAGAIKWVKQNISGFGGDTGRIFISGHSAGGAIAALVSADPFYFKEQQIPNPVKGLILIDAFGLDMYSYLKHSTNKRNKIYYPTFTNNPEVWKKASPAYYLTENFPPVLIFVGGKTYPVIKRDNERFLAELKKYRPEADLIIVNGKRHLGMIGRYHKPRSKGYREILDFLKK